jgi:hypothetical protein
MKINNQKGVSLLLTLLIMSALLAIALGLSQLSLGEIKLTRDIPKSAIAYYAAEAGIERAVYDEWVGDGAFSITDCSVNLSNGSSYGLEVSSGEDSVTVRSIGCYKGVRRAIEVSFSGWPGGTEPLCSEGAGSDDEDCGIIDCSGWYVQTGVQSPTNTEYCYNKDDITENRCEGVGDCKDPNSGDCVSQGNDAQQYSCGICKYINSSNCVGTILGSCSDYPAGTSCGSGKQCDGSGNCETACDPDMGDPCGGSICVNPGTIQCNGSCAGTSNKPAGTDCGTCNTYGTYDCDGSGNCSSYCSYDGGEELWPSGGDNVCGIWTDGTWECGYVEPDDVLKDVESSCNVFNDYNGFCQRHPNGKVRARIHWSNYSCSDWDVDIGPYVGSGSCSEASGQWLGHPVVHVTCCLE